MALGKIVFVFSIFLIAKFAVFFIICFAAVVANASTNCEPDAIVADNIGSNTEFLGIYEKRYNCASENALLPISKIDWAASLVPPTVFCTPPASTFFSAVAARAIILSNSPKGNIGIEFCSWR